MNPTPAWINRAAEEISDGLNHYDENGYAKVEFHYQIADIIAAHAPKVKPLEWVRLNTPDPAACHEQAYTVFRMYNIMRSGMSDIYFMNGSHHKTLESARAAAQADYCKRLAACYGEGGA